MSLEQDIVKILSSRWMHVFPGGSSLRLSIKNTITYRKEFSKKSSTQKGEEFLEAFTYDLVKMPVWLYGYAYVYSWLYN